MTLSIWQKRAFFLLSFISLLTGAVYSGSTGKIAGKVTDGRTGEVLPFVNVGIVGTTLGASTDVDGAYTILNIPPGVYTVVATYVGYQRVEVREVRVSVDFTTALNIVMSEGSVEMPAVVVQGERNPLIRKDLTNPVVSITSDMMQTLPVDNVSDVIRLQAGVVVDNSGGLHIRGGRSNEIAYSINGISVNNPLNNAQGIGIATNALQEISVSTGTFSAEYGDALSGVINYVTRDGGSDFNGSVRTYAGDYVSRRTNLFTNIENIDPFNRFRAEATIGGPFSFLGDASAFFVSGVFERSNGYMYGIRMFRPTDSYLTRNEFPSSDPRYIAGGDSLPFVFNPFALSSNGQPTGDGALVPMDTRESYNLTAKLSFKPFTNMKFSYDLLFTQGKSRSFSQAYRFNPDGRSTFRSANMNQTFGLTHTVNDWMFYNVKFGYLTSEGRSYAHESITDPEYIPSFFSRTLTNTSFLTGGTSLDRTMTNTSTITLKFDLVAQPFSQHEFKLGGDIRMHKLKVESYVLDFDKVLPAQLLSDSTRSLTTIIPTPAVAPDNLSYANFQRVPTQASFYFLDKIELLTSLIVNIGVRYEYYDPAAFYISDIGAAIEQQGSSLTLNDFVATSSKKHRIAPRMSVSYPISDRGIIRFSYGHFYQYPTYSDPNGNTRLSTIYRNPEFKAPSSSNPSFGNSNLNPQRSVQYEIGLQQAMTDDLKLDITGFYKDVNDYIEVQSVRSSGLGDRTYTVLANLNYANVKGVAVSFVKRRTPGELFAASLDYTYTTASGNRTDADAFSFDAKTGKQPEKLFVPLSFDRSHVLNGTVSLAEPNDWTTSAIWNFQTGTPYTPSLPSDLAPVKFDQNSARRPINWSVDLHMEKYFTIGGIKASVFLRVDNLFDTENEIFIYENSGKSLYSIDEVINASIFNDLRKRIDRGDFGSVADRTSLGGRLNEALDNYYRRADFLGSPREVRLGWTLLF